MSKDRYHIDVQFPVLMIEWTAQEQLHPLHWHDCLEIACCLEGEGWFHFEKKRFRIGAGDIVIVNNMEKHMTQADADKPSRYLFVKFDPSWFEGKPQELMLPFLYDPDRFCNRIAAEETAARRIGHAVRLMWEECNGRGASYRSVMEGGLLQICGWLARYYETGREERKAGELLSAYRKVKPALDFMKESYAEPITLGDIAERLNVSYSRAYHLFKEVVGRGFKEYLNQIRIHHAKELLAITDLPVTTVYQECGYQSHTPFYKAFKRETGMTPQAYRERHAASLVMK
jgi:AraC-like DNA-binding protein